MGWTFIPLHHGNLFTPDFTHFTPLAHSLDHIPRSVHTTLVADWCLHERVLHLSYLCWLVKVSQLVQQIISSVDTCHFVVHLEKGLLLCEVLPCEVSGPISQGFWVTFYFQLAQTSEVLVSFSLLSPSVSSEVLSLLSPSVSSEVFLSRLQCSFALSMCLLNYLQLLFCFIYVFTGSLT